MGHKTQKHYVYWFVIKDTAKEVASGNDARGSCGGGAGSTRGTTAQSLQVFTCPEALCTVVQEVLWSFHYAGMIG